MTTFQLNGQTVSVQSPERFSVALGNPRRAWPDRNQVRLRYRYVWRLHGSRGRPCDPLLHNRNQSGGRRQYHHHRGTASDWSASSANRLD